MKSKLAKQMLMYALIGGMAENSMRHFKDRLPEETKKRPALRTCPVCDIGHYGESRYCCEEHRIEHKEKIKAKRLKRKNKKRKFKH